MLQFLTPIIPSRDLKISAQIRPLTVISLMIILKNSFGTVDCLEKLAVGVELCLDSRHYSVYSISDMPQLESFCIKVLTPRIHMAQQTKRACDPRKKLTTVGKTTTTHVKQNSFDMWLAQIDKWHFFK